MENYNYSSLPTYPTSYSDDILANGLSPEGGVLIAMALLFAFSIAFILTIATVIGQWKAFTKAGKPGWAAIVPVYNHIVVLEIAGRPVWWVLLTMFVPLFGVWVAIVALIDLAKSYGKSNGFAALLIIFPIIGWLILGFGKDKYIGPIAAGREDFVPAPDFAPTAKPNKSATQKKAQPAKTKSGQPLPPGASKDDKAKN